MPAFKKLFLFIPLLVLSLYSCSKDDDSNLITNSPLEGKWQFTKEGTITNNREVLNNYQHTTGCTKDYIELLTGNIVKDHYFDNPDCQETIDTGNWSRNNNSLVLTYSGESTVSAQILELNQTTLKVSFFISGEKHVVIFTRI